MQYEISSLRDRKELTDQVVSLDDCSWPTFIQNGDAQSWSHFFDDLSEYVLVLTQKERVIAAGLTVPVLWDGKIDNLPKSVELVLTNGLNVKRNRLKANTLIPLGALVDSSMRGKGLSYKILLEMKKLAVSLNLESFVAPVRPTKKELYPLQSIHDYSQWRNTDGYLYDPWLRVHEKLGAKIIKIADNTLEVTTSLENWSKWTNLTFPVSGEYVVRGALSTVLVDKANNSATYLEPNVWMSHPM